MPIPIVSWGRYSRPFRSALQFYQSYKTHQGHLRVRDTRPYGISYT